MPHRVQRQRINIHPGQFTGIKIHLWLVMKAQFAARQTWRRSSTTHPDGVHRQLRASNTETPFRPGFLDLIHRPQSAKRIKGERIPGHEPDKGRHRYSA